MSTHASRSTRTVGELVADRPRRGRVFEQLGIDYCCGGRKSLAEACAQRGLDLAHVQSRLDEADAAPSDGAEADWTAAPLAQLADHIQSVYHDTMRRELPRLTALVQKVARVHGGNNPALIELDTVFGEFTRDLLSHMAKEDSVLFPWIRALEAGEPRGPASRPSLDQPIRRMMEEHDDAGAALSTMRELTDGFTPPLDACGTYRVMLSGLRDLEADMHIHVHKENNILFPRALAMETGGHSCGCGCSA